MVVMKRTVWDGCDGCDGWYPRYSDSVVQVEKLSHKNEFELVLSDNELFQAWSMGKHLRWRGK